METISHIRNCFVSAFLLLATLAGPVSLAAASASADGDVLKLNTVVLDAGHGGHDSGCISADRKTTEKNITLSVVKKLGKLINEAYPEVKVVYTRTTDVFVTLNNRAQIANRNNAGLFISIHVNAVNSMKPNGFSVHILGQSRDKNRDLFSYNSDICRRENEVILLEKDHSTKYEGFDPSNPESYIFFNLMSNAYYEQSLLFASCVHRQLARGPIKGDRGVWQDPFYVLWKTKMPAALIEIGFISNRNDLAVMRSESGKDQIARQLFQAFKEYKTMYDSSVQIDADGNEHLSKALAEESAVLSGEQSEKELAGISATSYYGVQVMTLGRKLAADDPSFKGHPHRAVKSGNVYKYIIGISEDLENAKAYRERVKARFPGCFVVKVEGNVVKRIN